MRPLKQCLTPILRRLDPETWLDAAARGWRGPALAALLALIAGGMSLFSLPPLDRDESRFAQATAQMLESGDLVMIKFQDQPRFKKPVGIYWLQAAAVSVVSNAEAREIWAYRLPSLLGAALAAAAAAWGGSAVFGPRAALIAGVLLGVSGLLSTEASIAKTDAVLCGSITLAMAAFGRLYASRRGGPPAGAHTRLLFWCAIALAILVKGPIGPLVVIMAGLALWVADRDGAWLKDLGWGWGLLLVGVVVLPWAAAITVATDGAFWASAVVGDLAPKLAGGQEGHGAWPGYHSLLAPLLIFPASLLLPAAAVLAWTRRGDIGVRFALAWLVPTWVMFEILPTKLVHYTLPVYGALTWLAAAAVTGPIAVSLTRSIRFAGAALGAVAALVFAAIAVVGMAHYGDPSDAPVAGLTAMLYLAAGAAGVILLLRGQALRATVASALLATLAHGTLAGALLPRLEPLWLSKRVAALLDQTMLDPKSGFAQGPVEVAGYAEPSLVFALGTRTGLRDSATAAAGLARGRPSIIEAREGPAFHAALAASRTDARKVGSVSGVDYSNGDDMTLTVYAPLRLASAGTTLGVRASATAPAARAR